MEEMLLQSSGHSGLARGRQPGEPESETALATRLVTLTAREGRVPGDVAIKNTYVSRIVTSFRWDLKLAMAAWRGSFPCPCRRGV